MLHPQTANMKRGRSPDDSESVSGQEQPESIYEAGDQYELYGVPVWLVRRMSHNKWLATSTKPLNVNQIDPATIPNRVLVKESELQPPNMEDMFEKMSKEEAEKKEIGEKVVTETGRVWDADFGHCFPDLLGGGNVSPSMDDADDPPGSSPGAPNSPPGECVEPKEVIDLTSEGDDESV